MKRRKDKKKKSALHILLPIFLALLGVSLVVLAAKSHFPIGRIASNSEKTIQIGTFDSPKPTVTPIAPTSVPTPGIECRHDTKKPMPAGCSCSEFHFRCQNRICQEFDQTAIQYSCSYMRTDWCNMPTLTGDGEDGWYCLGKPVIYLYPKTPTLVDVRVETTGEVVVSDPIYPEGGWKKVLAHPDGSLLYQGKNYTELFYESSITSFKKPARGITINSHHLKGELDTILVKLGLNSQEKQEFLDWWVPRLHKLNSPYIFFSLIEPQEKEKIDHVVYNPKPDTRIELLAYFKPLAQPYEGEKLQLPTTPPQRVGFTAVEWGGTIDLKN